MEKKAIKGPPAPVEKPVMPWEKALADLMEEGHGASARLALLSLAQIREKVGDEEFSRARRRIHLAIQTVMGRLLGSNDQILRAGEETYVILVRSMDIDKAQDLIQRGCTTLATLFFGEENFSALTFKADVTEIIAPDSSAEPRRFEITTSADSREAETIEFMEKPTEAAAAAQTATPPQKAAGGWQSMASKSASQLGFDLNFAPTWDATNKVLSTFTSGNWQCGPDGQFKDGLLALTKDNAMTLPELDARVVQETCDILCELHQNAFALLVVIPLHYSSLTTGSGREMITNAMRQVPPHIRKLISIEILDTPEDADKGILSDRIGQLKPFGRAVILALESWNASAAALAACPGVDAVSLFLPKPAAPRARMLAMLPDIAAELHKMKKIPAIVQVHTAQEIQQAVDAGVTFITGAGVGLPENLPGNMVRCTMKQLPYSQN